MKILVTGCAGFIGFHLCKELMNKKKVHVIGIDNLNAYYSIRLKNLRLGQLRKYKRFKFVKNDISDFNNLKKIFKKNKFDIIFNLAAQAGVRYSVKNPKDYVYSNILGFYNILELSRVFGVKKIFYASSSSVYGEQTKFPVKENQRLIPKNIYSLSKKQNEEIAELYQRYYGLKLLGLRFFTVYGEWGRPDMLMLKYMIAKNKKKNFILNNDGNHYRDFTYIKDVTKILVRLIFSKIQNKHDVVNICSNKPQNVKKILDRINFLYGKPKIINQKRLLIEVYKTHGSNLKIKKLMKIKNFTNIEVGLNNLIDWARKYLNKI
tara:strand:+ start:17 stop:976 length:960 start_codon:yes stop_codon:yes gene_type:complete